MVTWEEFIEIVKRNFEFLEKDFSFKKLSEKMPFVTYQSQQVTLDIHYDIERYRELDLGIQPVEKIDKFQRSFGIGVLIRLNDPEGIQPHYMSPFPKTKNEVEFEVKKLANLLYQYGLKVLKGDLSDLRSIQKKREDPKYFPYKTNKSKF